MTNIYGPAVLISTLNQAATGVAAALSADGADVKRTVVTQGEVVWDDCSCGQVAVTFTRIYPSSSFPSEITPLKQCDSVLVLADCQLSVTRCHPMPNANGIAPTPAQLLTAVLRSGRDAYIARNTLINVLCGLGDALDDWSVLDTTPIGPLGGCGGIAVNFKLAWIDCSGC